MSDRAVRRAQLSILGALLFLGAMAWVVLLREGSGDPAMEEMDPTLTMGMELPLFLTMWVLMMVAMMFPTAAPMILTFARVSQGLKGRGQPFVPIWFFVGSYLLVWSAYGLIAYLGAGAADYTGTRVVFLHENGARLGGAVLFAAGLYQLSPLKHSCLSKCRSPLDFILGSWKSGYLGAFRMGISHGTYCLGCCWLLFVILFPLGIMNVAAMGAVTVVIFAEKFLRHGVWVGRAVGLGLILLGTAVMVLPTLLPTTL